MPISSVGNVYTNQYLALARDALCVGDTRKGRQMALQALDRSANDASVQAQASLVLGHAYALESRFRNAHMMTSRAHRLFVRDSNSHGQVEALGVICFTACVLGLNDDALKAARDGISTMTDNSSPLPQAWGLNYSGVASLWAKDFGTARGALEASIWFTKQASDVAAAFQPLINLCFCEVLRIVEIGHLGRNLNEVSDLEQLVSRARGMASAGWSSGLNDAAQEIGLLLLDFLSCFVSSRAGKREDADAFYLRCLQRAYQLPQASWVQAVLLWARAERAAAYGDVESAVASLEMMSQRAKKGEHEQLRFLAVRLASGLRAPLNQWEGGGMPPHIGH